MHGQGWAGLSEVQPAPCVVLPFTTTCCTVAAVGHALLSAKPVTRGKFFTERLVRCWQRLPRKAVDAPSLEVLKTRLDEALGNLL